MRRKIATTVYLEQRQYTDLKNLVNATKVPMAEYIRTGIDMLFIKMRDEGKMTWPKAN